MKAEFGIYKDIIRENYREVAARPVEEKLFQFIKEYCLSKNIDIDVQTFAFALYYAAPITQSLNITDEQIKGISVYNVEGRKLMHHLFVKGENSVFQEVENVKIAVSGISANHIEFYLVNYVFADPQNKSYITIEGDLFKEILKNRNKYRTSFQYEIINTAKAQQPVDPERPQCNKHPLCFDFPDGAGAECVRSTDGRYACFTTINCASQEMSNNLAIKNMVESYFFNLDLMYSFRNNFLYNSEKGETYIENYYYLSEEYAGNINISLALQTALFFKDFNPVMAAFLEAEKHQTKIIFTDELSNFLFALLDKYEKITKSEKGKEILDSIRKDINLFRGIALKDILAIIK